MNKKTIFIIVIIVFVFSIFISFVAFSPYAPQDNEGVREKISERQEEIETDVLTGEKETKGIEGVVRKLEASIYMEGTHYLEAGGVNIALLESTYGIDLDKYVGENVVVQGKYKMTIEGDGSIIDVEKIELAK